MDQSELIQRLVRVETLLWINMAITAYQMRETKLWKFLKSVIRG